MSRTENLHIENISLLDVIKLGGTMHLQYMSKCNS